MMQKKVQVTAPIRNQQPKLGRNARCTCGSTRRYKEYTPPQAQAAAVTGNSVASRLETACSLRSAGISDETIYAYATVAPGTPWLAARDAYRAMTEEQRQAFWATAESERTCDESDPIGDASAA